LVEMQKYCLLRALQLLFLRGCTLCLYRYRRLDARAGLFLPARSCRAFTRRIKNNYFLKKYTGY
jgi:hypothetical protein